MEEIIVKLEPYGDMVDITDKVEEIVRRSGKKDGIAMIFVQGSTASVTTIEYEPGLKKDLPSIMDKLAPYNKDYEHHKTWHDDNGSAHIRASIIGPSISVPFKDGKLLLGTWQQVVVINWDTMARERKVVVSVF
jgi:secondary thiamine-phosphate synthase enzyme